MVMSMTGFATGRGQGAAASWRWELRGVNGKGLDLRLRLPEGIDGLEPAIRAAIGAAVGRGNLSLSLRLDRAVSADALTINAAALTAALTGLKTVQTAAHAAGVTLGAPSPAEVLALRGVVESGATEDEDGAELLAHLVADLAPVLEAFNRMRAEEGARLAAIVTAQIDEVERLTTAAATAAEARRDATAATLKDNLARVLRNAEGADETRVAQELALLAVKNDVTEELDRLCAHIAAARALLVAKGPVGRKFDFLMQEFNREANTLCSKAQSAELTRIGLDLKHVIDQMREQIQNVE
ncbi:MAG: YicC/YloC family endoribonuclease [Paracoccaceae bacterium]